MADEPKQEPKAPPPCMVATCTRPAFYVVGLNIYALPDTTPARAVTGLVVCEVCGRGLRVPDVLTDEGWALLLAVFKDAGRLTPDRKLSELVLTPLVPQKETVQ